MGRPLWVWTLQEGSGDIEPGGQHLHALPAVVRVLLALRYLGHRKRRFDGISNTLIGHPLLLLHGESDGLGQRARSVLLSFARVLRGRCLDPHRRSLGG